MNHWSNKSIFYHIYPLGFCDAPQYSEEGITHRILLINDAIKHMQHLGVNALYLGPVFASSEHGYDTSDYQKIDSRLGTCEDIISVCNTLHQNNIRVIFDGVFNHVGRKFWAFEDLLKNQENSKYTNWFCNVNFNNTSPLNDPFSYDAWEGHYNLVKLNVTNPEVATYLLESVSYWIDTFKIDGIRLDAADCIDFSFFQQLRNCVLAKDPNFWLMGEIIHGDYARWANDMYLQSATNYECYKGMYSSFNDKNFFEIAHSLKRQFEHGGIYENLNLYNFVDNHDVNRIGSILNDEKDFTNLFAMLFTIPGIPSIYYGSEWVIKGIKHDDSDKDIRPSFNSIDKSKSYVELITQLSKIRLQEDALAYGTFLTKTLTNKQLSYIREYNNEKILVLFNADTNEYSFDLDNNNYLDLISHKQFNECNSLTLMANTFKILKF